MQKTITTILLTHGAQVAIARKLGVCRKTVAQAIAGITRSERAEQIRRMAVEEYDGVEQTFIKTKI